MKKPSGIATKGGDRATLLCVSPIEEDRISLEHIFSRPGTNPSWSIRGAIDLESALAVLRQFEVSIVLTECNLLHGSWKDVLEAIFTFRDPPLLIVTSRLADERLWAEALNLGVFDVLPQPFNSEEVIRTFTLAWRHWQDRHGIHCQRTRQRAAESAA